METLATDGQGKIHEFSIDLHRLSAKDIKKIRSQLKRKPNISLIDADSKAKKPTKKTKKSSLSVTSIISVVDYGASDFPKDVNSQTSSTKKPTVPPQEEKLANSSFKDQLLNIQTRPKHPNSSKCRDNKSSTDQRLKPCKNSRKKKSKIINFTRYENLKSPSYRQKFENWSEDHKSYSTSEESELEEVFVPCKIWIKPSARPMSPTLPKPEIATDKVEDTVKISDTTPVFSIRQPIVLLKKINNELDTGSSSDASSKNTSNTIESKPVKILPRKSCCFGRQEEFVKKFPDEIVINISPIRANITDISVSKSVTQKEKFQSEVSVGKEHPVIKCKVSEKHCESLSDDGNQTQSFEPKSYSKSIIFAQNVVEFDTNKHFCQSKVSKPAASISCTSEKVTSTLGFQNDTSKTNPDESISPVLSLVIFEDEAQASARDLSPKKVSPVIFESKDYMTYVDNCDVTNPLLDSNQSQEATTNKSFETLNSSSGFVLELSENEHSDSEATNQIQDHEPTLNLSPDLNLQISESVTDATIFSENWSEEFNSISKNIASKEQHEPLVHSISAPKLAQLCNNGTLIDPKSSGNRKSQLTVAQITELQKQDKSPSKFCTKCAGTIIIPNGAKMSQSSLVDVYDFDAYVESGVDLLQIDYRSSRSLAWNLSKTNGEPTCVTSGDATSMKVSSKNYSQKFNSSVKSSAAKIPCDSTATNVFPKEHPQHSDCKKAFNEVVSSLRTNKSQLSTSRTNNLQKQPKITSPKSSEERSEGIARAREKFSNHNCNTTGFDDLRQCCKGVTSPNETKNVSCSCNVRKFFHLSEVVNEPQSHYEPIYKLASKRTNSADSCASKASSPNQLWHDDDANHVPAGNPTGDCDEIIDLTEADDEPDNSSSTGLMKIPPSGRIRLKTPSELGCTIAFTDDVERLFRHELPRLHCDVDKLELLQKKHFNIFKIVLAKYYRGVAVSDTLLELYRTRSVPCGSNLLKNFSPKVSSISQSLPDVDLKLFFSTPPGISSNTYNSIVIRNPKNDKQINLDDIISNITDIH